MTDPTLVLRGSQSGQIVRGTPTNKLAFDATGERVGGVTSSAAGLTSFNGRTAPAVVPQAGDYNSHEVADASTVGGPSTEDSLDTLNTELGTLSATVATLQGEICAKSGTTTTGAFACAENFNTTASGDHSHAEGNGGFAAGVNSHCEGSLGNAEGAASHCEGTSNRTDPGATSSHVEGINNHCTAVNSHAEGRQCLASADSAHAEGVSTHAQGLGAHSEGFGGTSSATGSHSEGTNCTASGDGAHAEGNATFATDVAAHAEGDGSQALTRRSHAGGANSQTYLDSEYAHAGGSFTNPGDAQFRAFEPEGATNGSVPGQAAILAQGLLAAPITLRPLVSYGITLRAIATRRGIGGGARESVFFYQAFMVTVDGAGNVTISAVVDVVPPFLVGASFVGATLVPSSPGVNVLRLTFTIGALLSVQSRIVARLECVEILGS